MDCGKCLSKEPLDFYVFHATQECIDSLPFDIWEDGEYHLNYDDCYYELRDGDHIVVYKYNIEVMSEEEFNSRYERVV